MKKVIIVHPGANQNFRNAALSLASSAKLFYLITSVNIPSNLAIKAIFPRSFCNLLEKRRFPVHIEEQILQFPKIQLLKFLCEANKLFDRIASLLFLNLSNDALYEYIDKKTSHFIQKKAPAFDTVYCYEDGAKHSFVAAKSLNKECIYELPIGYWRQFEMLMQYERQISSSWFHSAPLVFSSQKKINKDLEISLADKIIVPSSYVEESLRLHPGFSAKVYKLPYGCPPPISAKSRYWSDSGRLKLLFVGGLTQRKGLSYLNKIFHAVSDFCDLTVIGSGTKNETNCELLSKSKWYTNLTHKQVIQAMIHHDILLLPSLHEGMSLATLEALSCGMAVLVTRNSGTSDIITNGIDGFVSNIRDTQSMIRSIVKLRDHKILKSVGLAALDKARENNWDVYQSRLDEIIDD